MKCKVVVAVFAAALVVAIANAEPQLMISGVVDGTLAGRVKTPLLAATTVDNYDAGGAFGSDSASVDECFGSPSIKPGSDELRGVDIWVGNNTEVMIAVGNFEDENSTLIAYRHYNSTTELYTPWNCVEAVYSNGAPTDVACSLSYCVVVGKMKNMDATPIATDGIAVLRMDSYVAALPNRPVFQAMGRSMAPFRSIDKVGAPKGTDVIAIAGLFDSISNYTICPGVAYFDMTVPIPVPFCYTFLASNAPDDIRAFTALALWDSDDDPFNSPPPVIVVSIDLEDETTVLMFLAVDQPSDTARDNIVLDFVPQEPEGSLRATVRALRRIENTMYVAGNFYREVKVDGVTIGGSQYLFGIEFPGFVLDSSPNVAPVVLGDGLDGRVNALGVLPPLPAGSPRLLAAGIFATTVNSAKRPELVVTVVSPSLPNAAYVPQAGVWSDGNSFGYRGEVAGALVWSGLDEAVHVGVVGIFDFSRPVSSRSLTDDLVLSSPVSLSWTTLNPPEAAVVDGDVGVIFDAAPTPYGIVAATQTLDAKDVSFTSSFLARYYGGNWVPVEVGGIIGPPRFVLPVFWGPERRSAVLLGGSFEDFDVFALPSFGPLTVFYLDDYSFDEIPVSTDVLASRMAGISAVALDDETVVVALYDPDLFANANRTLPLLYRGNTVTGVFEALPPRFEIGTQIVRMDVSPDSTAEAPAIMVHGYMSYVDRVPTFSIGAVETGTDFADLGLLDSLSTVKAVFVVGTLVFVGGDFQSANEERAELVAVFDTTNDQWGALGAGICCSGSAVYSVNAFSATEDGSLVAVAGSFPRVNPIENGDVTAGTGRVVLWNGTRWLPACGGFPAEEFGFVINDILLEEDPTPGVAMRLLAVGQGSPTSLFWICNDPLNATSEWTPASLFNATALSDISTAVLHKVTKVADDEYAFGGAFNLFSDALCDYGDICFPAAGSGRVSGVVRNFAILRFSNGYKDWVVTSPCEPQGTVHSVAVDSIFGGIAVVGEFAQLRELDDHVLQGAVPCVGSFGVSLGSNTCRPYTFTSSKVFENDVDLTAIYTATVDKVTNAPEVDIVIGGAGSLASPKLYRIRNVGSMEDPQIIPFGEGVSEDAKTSVEAVVNAVAYDPISKRMFFGGRFLSSGGRFVGDMGTYYLAEDRWWTPMKWLRDTPERYVWDAVWTNDNQDLLLGGELYSIEGAGHMIVYHNATGETSDLGPLDNLLRFVRRSNDTFLLGTSSGSGLKTVNTTTWNITAETDAASIYGGILNYRYVDVGAPLVVDSVSVLVGDSVRTVGDAFCLQVSGVSISGAAVVNDSYVAATLSVRSDPAPSQVVHGTWGAPCTLEVIYETAASDFDVAVLVSGARLDSHEITVEPGVASASESSLSPVLPPFAKVAAFKEFTLGRLVTRDVFGNLADIGGAAVSANGTTPAPTVRLQNPSFASADVALTLQELGVHFIEVAVGGTVVAANGTVALEVVAGAPLLALTDFQPDPFVAANEAVFTFNLTLFDQGNNPVNASAWVDDLLVIVGAEVADIEVSPFVPNVVIGTVNVNVDVGTAELEVIDTMNEFTNRNSRTLTVLRNCPPGSINVDNNCPVCPAGSHSPGGAQRMCIDCPMNTTTYDGVQRNSSDCKCAPGFFEKAKACLVCDIGATCAGPTDPVARPGFFPDGVGANATFLACPLAEACLEGGECDVGYRGFLCAECDAGRNGTYYKLGMECNRCNSALDALPAVAAVAMFVVVGASIFFVARAESDVARFATMGIGFNTLQLMALFPDVSFAWPSSASNLFYVISFVNFSIELTGPECSVGSGFTFVSKWWFGVLTPVLVFLVYLVDYGVFVVWQLACVNKCCADRGWGGQDPDKEGGLHGVDQDGEYDGDGPAGGEAAVGCCACTCSVRACWRGCLRVSFARRDGGDLKEIFLATLRAFVFFLVLAYLPLAHNAMKILDCSHLSNGAWVLDLEPSTPCYNKSYNLLMLVAIPVTLGYSLGLPAFFLAILRRARKNLGDDVHIKYSFVTSRYKTDYDFWEVTVLLRKLAIVVAVRFFDAHSLLQAALIVLILFACTVLQQKHLPFKVVLHNRLETFSLGISLVILLFGMLQGSDDQITDLTQSISTAVVISAIVLLGVVVVGSFVYDIYRLLSGKSTLDRRASIAARRHRDRAASEALVGTDIPMDDVPVDNPVFANESCSESA